MTIKYAFSSLMDTSYSKLITKLLIIPDVQHIIEQGHRNQEAVGLGLN